MLSRMFGYMNSLQRYLSLTGMSAKLSIPTVPQEPDPLYHEACLGMYSDAPFLFWEFLSIGVLEFPFCLLERRPTATSPRQALSSYVFDSATGETITYEN